MQGIESRGLGAVPVAIPAHRSTEHPAMLGQMFGWAWRFLVACMQFIMSALRGQFGDLGSWGNRRKAFKMADQADDLGIPMKPTRPNPSIKEPLPAADLPRFLTGQRNAAVSPTSVPTRPPGPAQSPGAPLPRADQSTRLPDHSVEAKTLIVGQGISLSGEINSCARLVVEGSVQANLQACQHMIIAETGLFDGNAAIDDADIYGRFEGDLTVRRRLLIRASGRVSGTISYGQIEVEAGGTIAGSIRAA